MYKLKRYIFRKTLFKLSFKLHNCHQQRRQKGLVITQIKAMTAVSSSKKAAETGLQKVVNTIITKISGF